MFWNTKITEIVVQNQVTSSHQQGHMQVSHCVIWVSTLDPVSTLLIIVPTMKQPALKYGCHSSRDIKFHDMI